MMFQPPCDASSPLAPYQRAMLASMSSNTPKQQQQHQPHYGGSPSSAYRGATTSGARTQGHRMPQGGMTPPTGHRVVEGGSKPVMLANSPINFNPSYTPVKSNSLAASPLQPLRPVMAASPGSGAATSELIDALQHANKDELVQLLVDLSTLNPEACNYVDCKAQVFRLRPSAASSASAAYVEATSTEFSASGTHHVDTKTPVKQTFNNNNHADHENDTAVTGGASPYDKMAADQNIAVEERPFLSDVHPCMLQFQTCRNPQSCIFKHEPANLCLFWARGVCPNGPRCKYVHRLPVEASLQVRHVYLVNQQRQQPIAAPVVTTAGGATATPVRSMYRTPQGKAPRDIGSPARI